MNFKTIRLLIFCFLFTGCAYLSKSTVDEPPASSYPAPDPEMAEKLDIYRDFLDEMVGQKIATVQDTIRFGKPEGALGNMVADGLRSRASSELRTFVNVGIIGEGSFKIFFVPGELTLGDVYEFMPYDNHLVVLVMDGTMVMELIEQVAEGGGAPISGIRFRIDDSGNPKSVLVNAEVIDLDKEYLVATSSWAANGGDQFPALWNAEDRIDIDVTLQEVYADYFRNQVQLTSTTDARIRR